MWAISETAENKAFLIEVKRQRRAQRVPQKQMAHEMHVTQAAYSQLENGATELKLSQFIFICKRLQIPADKFIYQ